VPREHRCSREDNRDIGSLRDSINEPAQTTTTDEDSTTAHDGDDEERGNRAVEVVLPPPSPQVRVYRLGVALADLPIRVSDSDLCSLTMVTTSTTSTTRTTSEDVDIPGCSQMAAPFGWRQRQRQRQVGGNRAQRCAVSSRYGRPHHLTCVPHSRRRVSTLGSCGPPKPVYPLSGYGFCAGAG
jgi:hypothetical protein